MPKRSIVALKNCRNCKFKCSTNISEIERQIIFDNFWTLDDEGKKHFYSKTTENVEKKRCRTAAGDNSRRKTSYYNSFFVSNTQYRVCQSYYLSTLNISSHRVFYFHKFNKFFELLEHHCNQNQGNMLKKGYQKSLNKLYETILTFSQELRLIIAGKRHIKNTWKDH